MHPVMKYSAAQRQPHVLKTADDHVTHLPATSRTTPTQLTDSKRLQIRVGSCWLTLRFGSAEKERCVLAMQIGRSLNPCALYRAMSAAAFSEMSIPSPP